MEHPAFPQLPEGSALEVGREANGAKVSWVTERRIALPLLLGALGLEALYVACQLRRSGGLEIALGIAFFILTFALAVSEFLK